MEIRTKSKALWEKLQVYYDDDKYFILKINIAKDFIWALIIGLIYTFGKEFYNNYISNSGEWGKVFTTISNHWTILLLNFFISFSFTFIIRTIILNNIKLNLKLRNKTGFDVKDELFKLIKSILYDIDNPEILIKTRNLRAISYFLKTMNNRTGKTLEFAPDNESINLLHKVNGAVSITQATPSEWLNPTYNFFLINNYVASLKQKLNDKSSISKLWFSKNREDSVFLEFEKSKFQIIDELSSLSLDNVNTLENYLKSKKIYIRFYFLSENEIENNRSIIETLIAGHDLFGCYIYFINTSVLSDFFEKNKKELFQRLKSFISSIEYDLEDNNNKIDLMLAQYETNFDVIYRKEDFLATKKLEDIEKIEIQHFINELCKYLKNNYNEKAILFNAGIDKNNFEINNEFCHIYFK
ncbi:MAG: hypothetical protein H6554_12000 [Chitinophagales bacterium]|nr:hypothetical protein [Chitinophagales bacterium]